MQERERILELVKQGVISTEEAVVLLENIAVEKDEKSINKDAAYVKSSIKKETKTEQRETLSEEQYESLVEEVNLLSVQLDYNAEESQRVQRELREKEDGIMVINTMEELDELTDERAAKRLSLEASVNELKREAAELEEEKALLLEALDRLKRQEKTMKKEDFMSQFDIPEDWKQQTNDAINQVTDKMGTAGVQISKFIKSTLRSVNDNIDWKDVNVKVPGLVSQSFTHEFIYPNNLATIFSVKAANGKVSVKSWDKSDVKIEADIKLYGRMEGDSPLESFLERSHIDVSDEKIDFQIPNKRIKANLTIYLPKRTYDYVSIKMLNGNISLENMSMTDVYLKTTNGDMKVNGVSATMLEVEGVNGEFIVDDVVIDALVGNLMNGDIITKGYIPNLDLSLVNGDVKVTNTAKDLNNVDISLVTGTIKLAVAKEVGLDASVKTNLGSVKNRLADTEIVRENKDRASQKLQFRRQNENKMASLTLSTTTGTIYLKDAEH